jgi:hypothetical protein
MQRLSNAKNYNVFVETTIVLQKKKRCGATYQLVIFRKNAIKKTDLEMIF